MRAAAVVRGFSFDWTEGASKYGQGPRPVPGWTSHSVGNKINTLCTPTAGARDMTSRYFLPQVFVRYKDGLFLGVCLCCGASLGATSDIRELKTAEQQHICTSRVAIGGVLDKTANN